MVAAGRAVEGQEVALVVAGGGAGVAHDRGDAVLAGHVFDYSASDGEAFSLVTGLKEGVRAFLE